MNTRRLHLSYLDEASPGGWPRLVDPKPIPSTRFTRENSGADYSLPYPFTDAAPFIKRLKPGWKVIGWTSNDSLSPTCQRSESGGPYIAIMFTDPDGFDVWFHFGDYPYRFIESS